MTIYEPSFKCPYVSESLFCLYLSPANFRPAVTTHSILLQKKAVEMLFQFKS